MDVDFFIKFESKAILLSKLTSFAFCLGVHRTVLV